MEATVNGGKTPNTMLEYTGFVVYSWKPNITVTFHLTRPQSVQQTLVYSYTNYYYFFTVSVAKP
jgi:hypothetical protein